MGYSVEMRYFVMKIWSLIDSIYYSISRLQYIKQENGLPSIFRVRITKYKGHKVVLSDGTSVYKNDILVKIHLHNIRILKETQPINGDIKKAMFVYKEVEKSLPYLASYIQNHCRRDDIKAIIGITMINKGTKKLGFESYSIYNRLYRKCKQLIQYPIFFISHPGQTKSIRDKPYPVYLFMSKKILFEKYQENVSSSKYS